MTDPMLFDGHVHVHKRTDVGAMLSAAAANFSAAASRLGFSSWRGVLLLAEMAHRDWFAQTAASSGATFGDWRIEPPRRDEVWLRAVRQARGTEAREITIVAGRQVITSERIEVLAQGTRTPIQDGASLDDTIDAGLRAGALVVLPWGAGKWLGPRGRLVEEALTAAHARTIFAGDNRGRPSLMGRPAAFEIVARQGSPVLPGTDPLALPGEERNVGAFGFGISGPDGAGLDGKTLRELIAAHPERLRSFGSRIGPVRFIRNQTALRLQHERYP